MFNAVGVVYLTLEREKTLFNFSSTVWS